MRRIVLVGRSVGLMLEALSLEARTRGKDRRRKLSASLSLSLSLFLSLLSSPLSSHTRPPSCSLSYRPTFLTTRHCVPPRWNPVYSSTLWIFRKRFAASRAARPSSKSAIAASPRLAPFPLFLPPRSRIINRLLLIESSPFPRIELRGTFAKRWHVAGAR